MRPVCAAATQAQPSPSNTGVFQSIPAQAEEGPSGRKKLLQAAYMPVRPKAIFLKDTESVLQPFHGGLSSLHAAPCSLSFMVATTATPGELSSPGDLCEGRPLAVSSGLTSAERPPLCTEPGVSPGLKRLVFTAGCLQCLLLAGERWVLPFLGCFTLVPASRTWALPLFSQHN